MNTPQTVPQVILAGRNLTEMTWMELGRQTFELRHLLLLRDAQLKLMRRVKVKKRLVAKAAPTEGIVGV